MADRVRPRQDDGQVGLAIDLYRKETRCDDCGKLIEWVRCWLALK